MEVEMDYKADVIGYWSEIKLDIIQRYAAEYSKVMCAEKQKQKGFYHLYIDGFSGAGVHISKVKRELISGSPINALKVEPPFKEYHFVDLNSKKIRALEKYVAGRIDTEVHKGDCNSVLLDKVFPKVSYGQYRRGLCLLDPYGLQLNWEVIKTAGQMKSIEIFLNFPLMGINRNVLWRNPDDPRLHPANKERMNKFWGDNSWQTLAYTPSKQMNFFGEPELEKEGNETIAEGFRQRLIKVAGFKHVPAPMPMRNSTGAIVYYLYFATPHPVGGKIVDYIFDKYRLAGVM
jgi:three-Cys-motif partner protein